MQPPFNDPHFQHKLILLITPLGLIGVYARYLLDKAFDSSSTMAWGMVLSNLIGCFIIGLLFEYAKIKGDHYLNKALMVGLCGALTTFSGQVLTAYKLYLKDEIIQAFAVMAILPILGLLFLYFGIRLTSLVLR